ncbi:MAG: dihydroorotase [Leptolyngbyaceae cyanobacterium SL_7_1]|nr:dihydroorotase [Leptolyngbyaceae cyanobacterium SL_7_1]
MPKQLLRQIRFLDAVAACDRTVDVLLDEGTILAVQDGLEAPTDATVQENSGLILGTGLVDLYSHSGEPGFESRETLESLVQAAIAGGFTHLALLPDTQPVLDDPSVLQWFRAHSPAALHLHHWGALTKGAAGNQMAELGELAAAGVVGFADGQPLQNPLLVQRLLEYGSAFHRPIALWCCDRTLAANGVVREGVESMQLGLPGSPAIVETAPLAGVLELVEATGTPVHLMRISTARGVELIQSAKAKGLPITASTTWMHLLLNVTAVRSYDPNLRLDPPLGNPQDQAALIAGINSGVIDAIAIDHTPYTYEEKTVAFAEAPPGAIGLELALPLLWSLLVTTDQIPALTLWRCLSSNPARCLGLPAPDPLGELIVFDPARSWTVTPETLKSRSNNTPWLNRAIAGRVIATSITRDS